jgi:hypothetical protein
MIIACGRRVGSIIFEETILFPIGGLIFPGCEKHQGFSVGIEPTGAGCWKYALLLVLDFSPRD